MKRFQLGLIFIVLGSLTFIISLFLLFLIPSIYLGVLFIMFISVIAIAVGFAYAKGVDRSLDTPTDDCYYCKGTGKIKNEICPRCGGTGLSRSDD